MTKEEALASLKKLAELEDTETAHREADIVLCELLRALGHKEIVAAFDAIGKWYS